MARIRFVKPEFFLDAKLVRVKAVTRLFYIGLFTQTDREGRFLWNADDLKVKLIPYDRTTATDCLAQLADIGRIVRYGKTGEYGMIVNFLKHQYINPREPDSKIPPFSKSPIPNSYKTDTKTLDKGLRIKDKGEKKELKNSPSYLEKIPAEDLEEFYKRFDCSKQAIQSKAEDLLAWCETNGRTKRNYKTFLLVALKKDFPERKKPLNQTSPPKKVEDIPDTPETEENRKKAIAKMRGELQELGVIKKRTL